MFERVTGSPEETAEIAGAIAKKLPPGTVICLNGDLGAGKTLFVQNLARALGIKGEVTSPTFNLMNIYNDGQMPVVHFDLYRLESDAELDDIGFYEYSDVPDGLVVIEWAEKFPDNMPEDYLAVTLERGEQETERHLIFSAAGRAVELLKELEKTC